MNKDASMYIEHFENLSACGIDGADESHIGRRNFMLFAFQQF